MSYLEQLKTKISENAYPRLLTEPTKAPSVGFVNSLGWHVLQNEATPTDAAPLTPYLPCAVCGQVDRWDDRGIWRCRQCWPEPLTQAARRAEEREQAHLSAQGQAQHTSVARPKPRDPSLGPVLPPCVVCGELRHWHDHETDTWQCWMCTPPMLRDMGKGLLEVAT
jgi:hypothetical protein